MQAGAREEDAAAADGPSPEAAATRGPARAMRRADGLRRAPHARTPSEGLSGGSPLRRNGARCTSAFRVVSVWATDRPRHILRTTRDHSGYRRPISRAGPLQKYRRLSPTIRTPYLLRYHNKMPVVPRQHQWHRFEVVI
jgi:hypothetical protein